MNGESDDPRLPDGLREDLTQLYGRGVAPSSDVDRFVVSAARAHLAMRGRRRLIVRLATAAAVAAVLLLSVFILPQRHRSTRDVAVAVRPDTGNSNPAGDINGDGVIDIRDALLLARQVESHSVSVNRATDVNGDHAVDRKDVDAIAMIAVKLDAGTVR